MKGHRIQTLLNKGKRKAPEFPQRGTIIPGSYTIAEWVDELIRNKMDYGKIEQNTTRKQRETR